jgi:hypothetical protein
MWFPFGINSVGNVDEHPYSRLEIILETVPRPHYLLDEYILLRYPESENFKLKATGVATLVKEDVIDQFQTLSDELTDKYGPRYGSGDSYFDLFFDDSFESPPQDYWFFEPDYDGEPKLAVVGLHVERDAIFGWKVVIWYHYAISPEESMEETTL